MLLYDMGDPIHAVEILGPDIRTLRAVGYAGPLVAEREVGDQAGRMRDVKHGLDLLRRCLAEPVEPADGRSRVHSSESPRRTRKCGRPRLAPMGGETRPSNDRRTEIQTLCLRRRHE